MSALMDALLVAAVALVGIAGALCLAYGSFNWVVRILEQRRRLQGFLASRRKGLRRTGELR